MKRNINFGRFDYCLITVIVSGILLATINYIYNRSLWVDESMLALNIVNKSYADLLKPLDNIQVAPIGFLYLEKTLVLLFGGYDWVLRIVPFVSYLFCIPLLYILAKKLDFDNTTSLFATALFSINITLLSYSSEVKQYSSDILISLLLVLTSLDFIQSEIQSKKRIILYSLIGSILVWFSNVSVIILFTMGLYCLYRIYNTFDKKFVPIIIPILCWGVSFLAYYFLFAHKNPVVALMKEYWAGVGGVFMPLNIFSKEFYIFLFNQTNLFFEFSLGFGSTWLFPCALFGLGLFALRKRKDILYILLFPMITHLLLSSLKLYPFDTRLVLYLIPYFVMVISMGAVFAYNKVLDVAKVKMPKYLLLLVFAYPYFIDYKMLPMKKEEIKLGLEYLEENILPNDKLYIYYGATPAFTFYKDKYGNVSKTDREIMFSAGRKDYSGFEKDASKVKENTWLLFSHIYPFFGENKGEEERYIIKQIENQKHSVLNKMRFEGGSVYKVERKENLQE